MSVITDLLGAIGITGDILTSGGMALIDPTSKNIQSVVDEYAANGQIVPGKLMAYLLSQNEQRYPNDLYRGKLVPWLFLGAGVLIFLFARKK